MPELTVYRNSPVPRPQVCMYCGGPSTSVQEWREVNRRSDRGGGGGGTDVVPVTVGDDPVSGVLGLLLLPLALWQLFKAVALGIGAVVGWLSRPTPPTSSPPVPPEPSPTTLVVVTTCDRHRHFRRRFGWAWLGMGVALAGLWGWAVVETSRVWGTENVDLAVGLMVTAIVASVLLPCGVGTLRFFYGPVIVDRVTEGTVVLDRVRQAYFDVTGMKPTEPGT
jgi:hypothetical protein